MTPNEYNDHEFIKLREKVHGLEVEVARLQEARNAAEAALAIATKALERSQGSANEWREENIDQRALYPTIAKMEGMFNVEATRREALETRIYVMEKSGSQATGKNNVFSSIWTIVIGIAMIILGALLGKFIG